MEEELDEVESGKLPWKQLLRQFYGGFESNLHQVEKDMEGVYLKVPDEVTEEKCDLCGRNMVIKSGRFGRFLACPGYPECKFTKPLVVEMPGRCPVCGGRLMKRTGVSKKSGKQYNYYCCEKFPACSFVTFDVPVDVYKRQMHITVYLGASCGTDPHLAQAVRELGAWIGAAGHTLVYGGSKTGLMGLLAQSALAQGGSVIGVEPECFMAQDLQHDGLTQLIVTRKMCIRDRCCPVPISASPWVPWAPMPPSRRRTWC